MSDGTFFWNPLTRLEGTVKEYINEECGMAEVTHFGVNPLRLPATIIFHSSSVWIQDENVQHSEKCLKFIGKDLKHVLPLGTRVYLCAKQVTSSYFTLGAYCLWPRSILVQPCHVPEGEDLLGECLNNLENVPPKLVQATFRCFPNPDSVRGYATVCSIQDEEHGLIEIFGLDKSFKFVALFHKSQIWLQDHKALVDLPDMFHRPLSHIVRVGQKVCLSARSIVTPADTTPVDMTSAGMTPANMTSSGMTPADMTPAGMTSAGMTSADMTSAGMTSDICLNLQAVVVSLDPLLIPESAPRPTVLSEVTGSDGMGTSSTWYFFNDKLHNDLNKILTGYLVKHRKFIPNINPDFFAEDISILKSTIEINSPITDHTSNKHEETPESAKGSPSSKNSKSFGEKQEVMFNSEPIMHSPISCEHLAVKQETILVEKTSKSAKKIKQKKSSKSEKASFSSNNEQQTFCIKQEDKTDPKEKMSAPNQKINLNTKKNKSLELNEDSIDFSIAQHFYIQQEVLSRPKQMSPKRGTYFTTNYNAPSESDENVHVANSDKSVTIKQEILPESEDTSNSKEEWKGNTIRLSPNESSISPESMSHHTLDVRNMGPKDDSDQYIREIRYSYYDNISSSRSIPPDSINSTLGEKYRTQDLLLSTYKNKKCSQNSETSSRSVSPQPSSTQQNNELEKGSFCLTDLKQTSIYSDSSSQHDTQFLLNSTSPRNEDDKTPVLCTRRSPLSLNCNQQSNTYNQLYQSKSSQEWEPKDDSRRSLSFSTSQTYSPSSLPLLYKDKSQLLNLRRLSQSPIPSKSGQLLDISKPSGSRILMQTKEKCFNLESSRLLSIQNQSKSPLSVKHRKSPTFSARLKAQRKHFEVCCWPAKSSRAPPSPSRLSPTQNQSKSSWSANSRKNSSLLTRVDSLRNCLESPVSAKFKRSPHSSPILASIRNRSRSPWSPKSRESASHCPDSFQLVGSGKEMSFLRNQLHSPVRKSRSRSSQGSHDSLILGKQSHSQTSLKYRKISSRSSSPSLPRNHSCSPNTFLLRKSSQSRSRSRHGSHDTLILGKRSHSQISLRYGKISSKPPSPCLSRNQSCSPNTFQSRKSRQSRSRSRECSQDTLILGKRSQSQTSLKYRKSSSRSPSPCSFRNQSCTPNTFQSRKTRESRSRSRECSHEALPGKRPQSQAPSKSRKKYSPSPYSCLSRNQSFSPSRHQSRVSLKSRSRNTQCPPRSLASINQSCSLTSPKARKIYLPSANQLLSGNQSVSQNSHRSQISRKSLSKKILTSRRSLISGKRSRSPIPPSSRNISSPGQLPSRDQSFSPTRQQLRLSRESQSKRRQWIPRTLISGKQSHSPISPSSINISSPSQLPSRYQSFSPTRQQSKLSRESRSRRIQLSPRPLLSREQSHLPISPRSRKRFPSVIISGYSSQKRNKTIKVKSTTSSKRAKHISSSSESDISLSSTDSITLTRKTNPIDQYH